MLATRRELPISCAEHKSESCLIDTGGPRRTPALLFASVCRDPSTPNYCFPSSGPIPLPCSQDIRHLRFHFLFARRCRLATPPPESFAEHILAALPWYHDRCALTPEAAGTSNYQPPAAIPTGAGIALNCVAVPGQACATSSSAESRILWVGFL